MKPRIVFVHGLASSYESTWARYGWPELIEDLGGEAVPFELPGHGGSQIRPGDDAAAVDALLDFAAENDADTAVGFSAGSLLLLRAAARKPDAFARLVLTGVGDGMWNAGEGLRRIADAFESCEPIEDPGLRMLAAMARSAGNDPKKISAFTRGVPRQPSPEALRAIEASVLIVLGDKDDVGPADVLLGNLPTARLASLPGTDHYKTPSDPRAFDAVSRFLSE